LHLFPPTAAPLSYEYELWRSPRPRRLSFLAIKCLFSISAFLRSHVIFSLCAHVFLGRRRIPRDVSPFGSFSLFFVLHASVSLFCYFRTSATSFPPFISLERPAFLLPMATLSVISSSRYHASFERSSILACVPFSSLWF